MKKKILNIIGGITFIVLMVLNIQFVTNSKNGNLTFSSLLMQANAILKSGDCTDSPYCASTTECENGKGQGATSGQITCCTSGMFVGNKCKQVEL